MPRLKISKDLNQQLATTKDNEMLDIIIEISPTKALSKSNKRHAALRSALINSQKQRFARKSLSIETIIQEVGGEVLGRVWINNTLKARIPAQSIRTISGLQSVSTLDVPHLIEKD